MATGFVDSGRDVQGVQSAAGRSVRVARQLPLKWRLTAVASSMVDAELCGIDRRVRRLVRKLLGNGLTDVRFWGDGGPAEVDGEVGSMRHELSIAARAFKTQALAAADAPIESIAVTESFHSGALLPFASDLMPAG